MSEERYPQNRMSGRGSTRHSTSSLGRSDYCSWTATVAACEERLRASSWDDSDGDSADEHEIMGSKTRRIYTFDDRKESTGSVAYEINELKKQFFDGLRRENEKGGHVSERGERRIIGDRRQSPARIRRRTKSSSSPSPVREAISQISSEENEIDQVSLKSAECESKVYLNNFFSDLKSKRMGGDDATTVVMRDDGGPIYDRDCIEMYNQLHSVDSKDADGYLCKTSRKLSQILEVEENRKDLDKKSEENLELFRRNFRRPEELSPLETARSRTSARFFERDEDRFKMLHFDEFGNFHTIPRHSKGSLSDRTAVIFQTKIHDDFISLSAKSGKTQLAAPGREDSEVPFQYFCFTNPMVRNLSKEMFPRERGRNSESRESLRMEQGKNSTPRKSTERSERRTERTWSGKSRSDLPESPRFSLSIDSARSLKVEDVESNESVKKSENDNHSSQLGRRSQGSDGGQSADSLQKSQNMDDPNKENSDTSRSELSIDQKKEKRLGTPYSSSESIKQKELNQTSYRSQRRAGGFSRREGLKSGHKTPEGFHTGRRTQRSSGRSIDDRYREERPTKPDSATWSKLIDTFQGGSTHSFRLDSHFPGFPRQRGNSWDSDGKIVLNEHKPPDGKREVRLREATEARHFLNNSTFEAPTKETEDDLKSNDLDFKDFLLQKIKKEDVLSSLQTPQNLFYFNVNERGPFGIGEFGDVTYCTAVDVTERLQITGNSDTVDFGKPKDHGDGIPTQKAPGVIALPATDKREKDKTQRQFWTELRRDFRATPYGAEDVYFPRFIPIGLKTSKSDNCINLRIHEEIHAADHKPKNVETRVGDGEKPQKEEKPPSKTASECSGSESLSEDLEFECERTPRMSKSLSDLDTRAKDGTDSVKSIAQLLETATPDQKEAKEAKEASNLNEFLESRAEEKVEPKSSWLSLRKDSDERPKKCKTKSKKKGEGSPKEPFHEFLSASKGREPVPPLKLRNSNCFQNFYKRFISVFCLTSNSAATSK